jgi:hypothetical protein
MISATTASRIVRWVLLFCGLAVFLCVEKTLAAAQAGPPSVAPAQDLDLCAVSGIVTDAATRQPIEGVQVQLGPPSAGGYQLTDSRGRFVFTRLRAGSYFLNATRPGYRDAAYGRVPTFTSGARVILKPGQWFDSANIEMSRFGVVGGRVLDELGEPLIGVYVRVFSRFALGGTSHFAGGPIVQTDDRGEYRFTDLVPGAYLIAVPSPQNSLSEGVLEAAQAEGAKPANVNPRSFYRENAGVIVHNNATLVVGNYAIPPNSAAGRPQAYPLTFYPGTTSPSSSSIVSVPSGGEVSGMDISVRPVPAVRVSGRLVGGSDYTGYVLRLVPIGSEGLGTAGEQATTAVSPTGEFTFLRVPAGSYTLLAPGSSFSFTMRAASGARSAVHLPQTPGAGLYRNELSGPIPAPGGISYNARVIDTIQDPHAGYASLAITVGDVDLADVIVQVEPGARVHGQVNRQDSSEPLPAGLVEIAPADRNAAIGVRSAGIPGATGGSRTPGSFTLLGVQAGEYMARVSIAGFSIKSVALNGEDYSRRPFRLKPGETAKLEINVTSEGPVLKGSVRGNGGEPVSGCLVVVFPVDRSLWVNYGWTPSWMRTGIVASDASYEITGLRAAEYYVVAVRPSQGQDWAELSFLESAVSASEKLVLGWGTTMTLDLRLSSGNRR